MNPNPTDILNQAREHAIAGQHEAALAKHLWYHQHAVEIEPAQSAVRRSFAMSYWHELGLTYPPAMQQLKAARDAAAESARRGQDVDESFSDAKSFNRHLNEEEKTVALFLDIERLDEKIAGRIFHVAQSALVKAKKYATCSKYLDPKKTFPIMVKGYRWALEHEKERQARGELVPNVASDQFTNQASTLVALLAVNDRRAEAEQIAAEARNVLADPNFDARLDDALDGKVPAPWP